MQISINTEHSKFFHVVCRTVPIGNVMFGSYNIVTDLSYALTLNIKNRHDQF